jgi:hypothetical protein
MNIKPVIPSFKTLSVACAFAVALGASAQNLVQNPDFTVAGSPSGASWSAQGGGYSYYYESAVSANILSLGWWDGCSFWQNTTATIQPGVDYQLAVTAQVGQSPVTGMTLQLQDVSLGWATEASQSFTFASQSTGPAAWQTFTLNIPASTLSSLVGDTIGVGGVLNETPNTQYGWLWVDSVSLTAAPEPTSLALLGLGAAAAITALRRRKQ